MAFDAPKLKSGQAMAEFAIALLSIVLIAVATVEFLPVFLDNLGLLNDVRSEAGEEAISGESGVFKADRSEEFDIELPFLENGDGFASGMYSEKLAMPAANLHCGEYVHVPHISGMTETMRCTGRDGTSEFASFTATMPPRQALAAAVGAMSGAGWTEISDVSFEDSALLAIGGDTAPSAVAAVHAGEAPDGSGLACVTVIARTSGSVSAR